jgi:hypothetical protein
MLTKADLDEILNDFPDQAKKIMDVAKERLERDDFSQDVIKSFVHFQDTRFFSQRLTHLNLSYAYLY